jgi:hypothetical protein
MSKLNLFTNKLSEFLRGVGVDTYSFWFFLIYYAIMSYAAMYVWA